LVRALPTSSLRFRREFIQAIESAEARLLDCQNGSQPTGTITPDWHYVVRKYQPREEILDGSWKSQNQS
jgi:hypothetical protein